MVDSKTVLLARMTRRQIHRWQALLHWRRNSLQGIPVLFANSFPKSGTHLLTQVLEGLTLVGPAVNSGLPAVVTYQGDTGRARSEGEVLSDLGRFKPGDIGYGHLHAWSSVVNLLCQPGYATWFLLRDPRDVVVSHVHYVTDMEPKHVHHRFYRDELHTFDERLRVSILGRPESDLEFPNIYDRMVPYLGWMNRPEIYVLRYEDFARDRQGTIGQALDYAASRGFPLIRPRQDAIRIVAEHLDPRRSPTFRSGKAGGWREVFSPENTRLFKEIAGNLLITLGYEQDLDWKSEGVTL